MHVFFFSMAYLFAFFLLLGAFFCLYLGWKLVARRTRSATARTEFSGRLGEWEFTIGAGSVAGLALAISVLWVAVAFMARPKITFDVAGDGSPGWINVIANVQGLGREDYDAASLRPNDHSLAAAMAAADAADAADAAATAAADAAEATAAAAEDMDAAAAETAEAADLH